MKIFLVFAGMLFASTAANSKVITVYKNIEEFTVLHPDVKLVQLIAEDHEVDGSRSYSLGARQTGKIPSDNFR